MMSAIGAGPSGGPGADSRPCSGHPSYIMHAAAAAYHLPGSDRVTTLRDRGRWKRRQPRWAVTGSAGGSAPFPAARWLHSAHSEGAPHFSNRAGTMFNPICRC